GKAADGGKRRRRCPVLPTHYGRRIIVPPAVISNSSRRFCAQHVSLLSVHIGRSSPKLVVSIRESATPRSTRYRFAAAARRCPSARLYSEEPRSSACPEMRMVTFELAIS